MADNVTLNPGTGGSVAPMAISDGTITFSSVIPPVSSTPRPPIKSGGGAATFDQKQLIALRQKQLAQDDEEIMIFVKSFLTQYGAD